MKNTKLGEVWSKRHLPQDLWPEILCRLPVKSLLRFRCASKSWLSLIEDRDFARLHLKNFKNNCDETHFLVVEGEQNNCVVRCSDTFEINAETHVTLGQAVDVESWHVRCAMDGLVTLRRIRPGPLETSYKEFKVWNPSIRKFHEFAPLPEIEITRNKSFMDVDIGLGYDPLANDYKHVKFMFVDGLEMHSVAVYSLGAGSWKIIPFQGKGSSSHWVKLPIKLDRNVCFWGSMYFMVTVVRNIHLWELVSYDLSSEMFSSISLPDDPLFRCPDLCLKSELVVIDGGCSLAIYDSFSPKKSVWVLESSGDKHESVCWTKRYSFYSHFDNLFFCKTNGDLLTQRWCTEESVLWDEVGSYSLETEEYKILQDKKGFEIYHVSAYFESLVLLK